jgi:hypothetical protein
MSVLASLEPVSWLAAVVAALAQVVALIGTRRQARDFNHQVGELQALPEAIRASGDVLGASAKQTISALETAMVFQSDALERAQNHHHDLAQALVRGGE